MVPRHSSDTFRPVRPNNLYFMLSPAKFVWILEIVTRKPAIANWAVIHPAVPISPFTIYDLLFVPCDTDNSDEPAGRSARSVTACGEWEAGPAQMIKSRFSLCRQRLTVAAPFSTPRTLTAGGIGDNCLDKPFAPTRTS